MRSKLKLDQYDLSKYVIILTGATDGIGKEMARILSGFNPKCLILPARNKEKGIKLLDYIESSNGHADNVEIWEMDLADLQSVKNFANKFIEEVGELHILINNAAVWTDKKILKTKDNLELQFQVNHLSPFLLTRILLDTIKKSVSVKLPGKIVFTSSETQEFGEIDFDNLNLEKGNYTNVKGTGIFNLKAYANTKLMNVIISKEFGRILRNENIITYSVHPGFIQTNINNNCGIFMSSSIKVIMKLFGGTPTQGAINVLYHALYPKNKGTGNYYHKGYEQEPNKLANDQEIAKKLWKVSVKLLRVRGVI